eukprot:tig00001155_g7330.t1
MAAPKLCPAAAALARKAAEAAGSASSPDERCPVTGLTLKEAMDKEGRADPAQSGKALGGTGDAVSKPESAAGSSGGACPYGFKSNAKVAASLDPYTCPVCKSLFYECCDVLPCQHSFCAGCLRRFRDCPMCGRDVEGAKPNEEKQRLINAYLLAHAHEHKVETVGPFSGLEAPSGSSETPERMHNRAVFHLQLALRAHAAGNLGAAAARCQAARTHMMELIAMLKTPLDIEQAQYELGVVCGKLGDVRAAAGAADDAERWYRDSLAALHAAGSAPHITQALTVSANKLGDLLYRCGVLEGRARDDAAVDVAVSLGKLGDLEGRRGAPRRRGRRWPRPGDPLLPAPDLRSSEKCQRYLGFFESALRALDLDGPASTSGQSASTSEPQPQPAGESAGPAAAAATAAAGSCASPPQPALGLGHGQVPLGVSTRVS